MWTSVTGLLAHGEKMNVVGNNIANVNTVAFKGSRMDFQDFVNQNVYAAAGPSQVGRGVSIGAVFGNFAQGSFENTTEPTDLAIHGNGFFKVKPLGTDQEYYTRAGNFRFDADGYLVDPNGYALQGWRIQVPSPGLATTNAGAAGSSSASGLKGAGAPTDVHLETFTCDPKHTNNISLELNLDASATDKSRGPLDANDDATDPFLALFHAWDSTQSPALNDNAYTYQHTMNVYDEGGSIHKITIYFDKVSNDDIDDPVNNIQHWEYIVTMDPAEDNRDFGEWDLTDPLNPVWDSNNPYDPDFKGRGLLMAGSMTFNSTGEFDNMTAYVPKDYNETADGNWDPEEFVPAPISSNGFPLFCPNFSGAPGASTAWKDDFTGLNQTAQSFLIELNLGIRNKATGWDLKEPVGAPTIEDSHMGTIGREAAKLSGVEKNSVDRQPSRTRSRDGASGSLNQSQDGYSFGYLSTVYVDRDGVLYGKYSNGQTLSLYQITLYDFDSPHNLYREGGNLFSETKDSGQANSGPANSMGMGSIYGNSLEQSNVDLATEFVQMISTQRGFQANSKSITTVDTMLETVISMKR